MSETNGSSQAATAKPTFGSMVHISGHPVIAHKITILRSSATSAGTFRSVMKEVTYHLGYEATNALTTEPVHISVPVPTKAGHVDHMDYEGGHKLKERVALIPILRSGLGLVDAMLELLPTASVHHIGMYKVLGSNPVQYYNRLPRECKADVAYVLDPVIRTSSTIMSVIGILKKWGVPTIHVISVIGSREGLQSLVEAHGDVRFTVGVIDDAMTEDGIVLPGMGDTGDRQFGTALLGNEDDDHQALMHHSKRKRSASQSFD